MASYVVAGGSARLLRVFWFALYSVANALIFFFVFIMYAALFVVFIPVLGWILGGGVVALLIAGLGVKGALILAFTIAYATSLVVTAENMNGGQPIFNPFRREPVPVWPSEVGNCPSCAGRGYWVDPEDGGKTRCSGCRGSGAISQVTLIAYDQLFADARAEYAVRHEAHVTWVKDFGMWVSAPEQHARWRRVFRTVVMPTASLVLAAGIAIGWLIARLLLLSSTLPKSVSVTASAVVALVFLVLAGGAIMWLSDTLSDWLATRLKREWRRVWPEPIEVRFPNQLEILERARREAQP